MEGFFLFLLVIVIFSSLKSGKKASKVKAAPFMSAAGGGKKNWARDAQKLNTARRSVSAGSAAMARYRREQKKKYKAQIKANSGLWRSKHRIDMNRKRRTDWGAQGDQALLSPAMIGIIGSGLVALYLALSAVYG